jgi:hypothetical protein
MEVLAPLRGLQKGFGNEKFLDKFPELAGLEETIAPFVKHPTERYIVQCYDSPSNVENLGDWGNKRSSCCLPSY